MRTSTCSNVDSPVSKFMFKWYAIAPERIKKRTNPNKLRSQCYKSTSFYRFNKIFDKDCWGSVTKLRGTCETHSTRAFEQFILVHIVLINDHYLLYNFRLVCNRKLQKAHSSFVIVCLSAWNNSDPARRIFIKCYVGITLHFPVFQFYSEFVSWNLRFSGSIFSLFSIYTVSLHWIYFKFYMIALWEQSEAEVGTTGVFLVWFLARSWRLKTLTASHSETYRSSWIWVSVILLSPSKQIPGWLIIAIPKF
jgi:hypothetical protein